MGLTSSPAASTSPHERMNSETDLEYIFLDASGRSEEFINIESCANVAEKMPLIKTAVSIIFFISIFLVRRLWRLFNFVIWNPQYSWVLLACFQGSLPAYKAGNVRPVVGFHVWDKFFAKLVLLNRKIAGYLFTKGKFFHEPL